MSIPVLDPVDLDQGSDDACWMVLIYNNETNSMDEVVEILMVATGCGVEEALVETWDAHLLGKAAVHFASALECQGVAKVISSIGVRTEVSLEWPE